MPSGPANSGRQSLEQKAVALFDQDIAPLCSAIQRFIPAGELTQAKESMGVLKSRLNEVEELLREIERLGSEPSRPTEQPAAAPESEKRQARVLRAPCEACGQVYPLRIYKTGWRYRWLCYRCRQKQFPASAPQDSDEGGAKG